MAGAEPDSVYEHFRQREAGVECDQAETDYHPEEGEYRRQHGRGIMLYFATVTRW